MTSATVFANAVSGRNQGRRALLWFVPLTAAWLGLNYVFPELNASGVQSAAVRLGIHVALALGLWLTLERTELTARQRLNTFLALIVPFTIWLALIWSAAINGVFRPVPGGGQLPLLPLAIFLPVLIGAPILSLSKRVGQVLDAMPSAWLVALQMYRVFGGVFLLAWLRGALPGVFALPAGIGDVMTGLMALPIAYYLAAGTVEGRRAGIAWNIFGLVDFAVAVGMGLITAPGPLQLIVPSVPSVGAGVYPTIMIPAFAVPSSILLHVLSLRQLRRRSEMA